MSRTIHATLRGGIGDGQVVEVIGSAYEALMLIPPWELKDTRYLRAHYQWEVELDHAGTEHWIGTHVVTHDEWGNKRNEDGSALAEDDA